jgi:hypothetical protein
MYGLFPLDYKYIVVGVYTMWLYLDDRLSLDNLPQVTKKTNSASAGICMYLNYFPAIHADQEKKFQRFPLTPVLDAQHGA